MGKYCAKTAQAKHEGQILLAVPAKSALTLGCLMLTCTRRRLDPLLSARGVLALAMPCVSARSVLRCVATPESPVDSARAVAAEFLQRTVWTAHDL